MHCPYCNGLLMKCYSDFGGRKFSSDKCRCYMCGALFIIHRYSIEQIPRKRKDVKYPLFSLKTLKAMNEKEDENAA